MLRRRSESPLTPAEKGQNLFGDSEVCLGDCSSHTKYKQINKNLQGIIAYCAEKLASSYSSENTSGRQAAQRGYRESFVGAANEGDSGRMRRKWKRRDEKVPEKMNFRENTFPGSRVVEGMFGPAEPIASEEFQGVAQHFVLTEKCGSELSTLSPSKRRQTRKLHEFGQTAFGNSMIVQRRFSPAQIQSERSFAVNVNINERKVRNRFRNFSGSAFLPLKCTKCQLEGSKKELETTGWKLQRMKGSHRESGGCSGCECNEGEMADRHFCSGDEVVNEWACTCGQVPTKSRELHKQENRDSQRTLFNNSGSGCLQLYPGLNVLNFGCFQDEKLFKFAPNFVRHEDTHGKCRDCYRQDMLQDAFKLKNSIDMEYQKQKASVQRGFYEGHGNSNSFSARYTMNESGENAKRAIGVINSDSTFILDLARRSNSITDRRSKASDHKNSDSESCRSIDY